MKKWVVPPMKPESIKTIKENLALVTSLDSDYVRQLRADQRSGVQKCLEQLEKRLAKEQALRDKYHEMTSFERGLYAQGHRFIAGIDEVGRGPLAGPVVAAAVILPPDYQLLGLNDSKQLSAAKRGQLYQEIQENAVAIGIGVMDQEVIDEINILQASKKAMIAAVKDLGVTPSHLLIDATTLNLPLPQDNIIKGDARSVSIAAASIIAKEMRDNLMKEYHQIFPHYGFDRNAGYGTKEHLEGLAKYGVTSIHRRSFAPVKQYL